MPADSPGCGGVRVVDSRFYTRTVQVKGRGMFAYMSATPVSPGAPVVVLLPGFAIAGSYLLSVGDLLAREFHTYIPDLPGFGRSERPPRPLKVAEIADAVAEWMDVLGVGRAAIIGNSFSCQIAIDLALRYTRLTERIVLAGPTVDPQGRSISRQLWRVLRNALQENPPAGWMRDYAKAGPVRLLRTGSYALQDRVEDKLPHIDRPVLVVRGGRDPIAPQRWVERVAGLLPRGRLVVIPGASHTIVRHTYREFVEVVAPFIRGEHCW